MDSFSNPNRLTSIHRPVMVSGSPAVAASHSRPLAPVEVLPFNALGDHFVDEGYGSHSPLIPQRRVWRPSGNFSDDPVGTGSPDTGGCDGHSPAFTCRPTQDCLFV